MRGLFKTGQCGVGSFFGTVTIQDVAEDVRGDVFTLGGDVRVDVEVQVASGCELGVGGDDSVEEVRKPEEVGFVFHLWQRNIMLVRFVQSICKVRVIVRMPDSMKATYHPVEINPPGRIGVLDDGAAVRGLAME
jgi:hypothetical protein